MTKLVFADASVKKAYEKLKDNLAHGGFCILFLAAA